MKQTPYYKDEGIVLKKIKLPNESLLVNIFTKDRGKVVLTAYGVKKITSRRIAHLDTGNYILFQARQKDQFLYLEETELSYGYSKIKSDSDKVANLFTVLRVLQQVVPENQPEPELFALAKRFLQQLNNQEVGETIGTMHEFLSQVLVTGGFVTDAQVQKPTFDPLHFMKTQLGMHID